MHSVHLVLPFPPTVNTYWRRGLAFRSKKPMTYLSAKGRKYRVDAMVEIMRLRDRRAPPGRLDVTLTFHAPDARVRDLDNYPKAVLDALTHAAVIKDDSLIDRLTLVRGACSGVPRVCVSIGPIAQKNGPHEAAQAEAG